MEVTDEMKTAYYEVSDGLHKLNDQFGQRVSFEEAWSGCKKKQAATLVVKMMGLNSQLYSVLGGV